MILWILGGGALVTVVGALALRRTKPDPVVHSCEICSAKGVRRVGIWDYCPHGHTYVGRRAQMPPAA